MKRSMEKPGNILDRALTEIRNTPVPAEQVEEAAERVLKNLGAQSNKVVPLPDRIQSCGDFRALFPAYLSASLTPSRKLLLEDHIHECVACRKAMEGEKWGRSPKGQWGQTGLTPQPHRAATPFFRGAAAVAAAAVLVVAALQTETVRDFMWPIDVHATAVTVEGGLYRFSGQDVRAVTAGQRIERDQAIRTSTGSGAVLELADGSRIEMGPRAQIALDRVRDGVKIRLDRGNVIVTAAKQRDGHLYVETKDCTISVVGTVFSVNSGAKGSRVSVIEGEVHVKQGEAMQALFPGQQVSTSSAMGSVPVQQEIAWSRDLEILKELLTFGENVSRRLEKIEVRRSSHLVPLVPENTLVFAALPNISQSIGESYALFRRRLTENQMLADWWQPYSKGPDGLGLDQMVERMTRVGAYLGPEIILAIPKDLNGEAAVLLADVTQPDQLVNALKEDPALLSKFGIHVDRDLLVISTSDRQIQRTLAFRQRPGSNPFMRTALFRRLEQAYVEGAGWLLAADLQQLVTPGEAKLEQLGLANVQQFVVEQKTGSGGASYRATLGFSQTRRGMAAWLAEPAPMGALEFVSPKAYGVAAVVTRDPALMVDDLFGVLQNDATALADLENYQREHRLDIRQDIAAPLGNEFLVAVDGPILPNPSWKVVIEVNDAARLQNAIERSIADLNREAAARQREGMTLTSETSGGRTFYSAASVNFPTGIHYTFWAGYMIIAPSRALVIDAIQNHDTGNTLARSAAFRSQFPADGRDYASGFVYQNIQSLANGVSVNAVQVAADALPTLICLYGAPDRIVMSSKGVLSMNIAGLTGISGMLRASGLPR